MKILIVEDDPMVGRINKQFAEKTGLAGDVVVTDGVEKARQALKGETFDLVLLDVYLPDARGTDLLHWIRKEDLPVSVILITADRNPRTIEQALNLGAADYLVKPFTYERFAEALERARKRKEVLHSSAVFEQERIDSLIGKKEDLPRNPDAPELDKGLNRLTYEKIMTAVTDWEGLFTADEISSLTGMSRVTVRRYLEQMEDEGLLKKTMEYGKPGRPVNKYLLAGRDRK